MAVEKSTTSTCRRTFLTVTSGSNSALTPKRSATLFVNRLVSPRRFRLRVPGLRLQPRKAGDCGRGPARVVVHGLELNKTLLDDCVSGSTRSAAPNSRWLGQAPAKASRSGSLDLGANQPGAQRDTLFSTMEASCGRNGQLLRRPPAPPRSALPLPLCRPSQQPCGHVWDREAPRWLGLDGEGACAGTCAQSSNDKSKEVLRRMVRMSIKQDNLSWESK